MSAAAAPEPAEEVKALPAPAGLSVDVAGADSGVGGDVKSPGFNELVGTPRETPRGTSAGWAAPGEEAAGSSKGSQLTGARAAAHDVDFDIDIDEPAAAAPRPRPSAPKPSPAAAASSTAAGSAQPRTTLSVSDYKRRAGIA